MLIEIGVIVYIVCMIGAGILMGNVYRGDDSRVMLVMVFTTTLKYKLTGLAIFLLSPLGLLYLIGLALYYIFGPILTKPVEPRPKD